MVGYVLGGLPGSRLLDRLGIPNSADTILRRVKTRMRGQEAPPVRVLGVDDWAWRKQQHYGTMLMDLERQRVIDLLPCRCDQPAALLPGSQRIQKWRSSLVIGQVYTRMEAGRGRRRPSKSQTATT